MTTEPRSDIRICSKRDDGRPRAENSPSGETAKSVVVHERRMQILETENNRLMQCQGQLIRETNRKLELFTNENRFLQYAFDKLKKQNTELKELCYFLDDERKAAKSLHQELLETEKTNKKILSEKDELIKSLQERERTLNEENLRLKTLCDSWMEYGLKYSSLSRDCPDGSSDSDINLLKGKSTGIVRQNEIVKDELKSTHNYVNFPLITAEDNRSLSFDKTDKAENPLSSSSETTTTDKTLSYDDLSVYVKSLEIRVRQLEKERNDSENSRKSSATFAINDCEVGGEVEGVKGQPGVTVEDDRDSLENLSPMLTATCSVVNGQAVWPDDDYEEISTVYMNSVGVGDLYLMPDDDTDNNNLLIALSPIAEESETELVSSSCSSLCDNETLSLRRNRKLSNVVWKCIDINDVASCTTKMEKNSIKLSDTWVINNNNNNDNVFESEINLHNRNKIDRYSSNQSDSVLCFEKFERLTENGNHMDERKINNLTLSVDSLSSRDFLDHLSNNLQSTTI